MVLNKNLFLNSFFKLFNPMRRQWHDYTKHRHRIKGVPNNIIGFITTRKTVF